MVAASQFSLKRRPWPGRDRGRIAAGAVCLVLLSAGRLAGQPGGDSDKATARVVEKQEAPSGPGRSNKTEAPKQDALQGMRLNHVTPEKFKAMVDSGEIQIRTEHLGSVKTGARIAEFSLEALDGSVWTLESLQGKITLMAVWATWCLPCRASLPRIQSAYEEGQRTQRFRVVTVNIDKEREPVVACMNEAGYSFPVLLQGSEWAKRMIGTKQSLAIPLYLTIGEDGIVKQAKTGSIASGKDLLQELGLNPVRE